MDISLKNISYDEDGRHILKNVSCTLLSSQVTCVMGMTGSGKTVLIDTIVGRRHGGRYFGTIRMNGAVMKHANIAYCQSVDIHMADFTVMQHLRYACHLRLGGKVSYAEREEQCRLTAAAVGLKSVMHSVVGLPGDSSGLSDGERKLLSIAIELVGVPPVLCLDDPFAGLDTATTSRVANVLNLLAHHHNKTIVCSISVPSDQILSYCDNLLLLSLGEIVFSGHISKLNEFIGTVNTVSMPDVMACLSPLECLLEQLCNPTIAAIYTSAWRECDEGEWFVKQAPGEGVLLPPPPSVIGADSTLSSTSLNNSVDGKTKLILRHPEQEHSLLDQLFVFIKRHAHYKLIAKQGGVKTILGRFIVAGILFGFTFKDVGQKLKNLGPIFNHTEHHLYAAVYNILGLMFCYSVFVTVSNFLPIPILFDMRKVYQVEMTNKLYHPIARWLAVLLVDVPIIAFGTCLFIMTSTFMIKPNGKIFNYYILVSFASVIGFSYANLCVELSRSLRTSILLFGMSAALSIWFSGYSISTEQLMDWISWTPKCSHLYWATGSMMYEELSYLPPVQRDFLLGKYKYDDMTLTESYRNLGITFVVIQLVLLCLVLRPPPLKFRSHKRQNSTSLNGNPIEDAASSAPLINKNSFLLTSEEEDMLNEFYGPPRESTSFLEVYSSPPTTEHVVAVKDRAVLTCRRFSYTVQEGRLWARKEVGLLNNINLVVLPGELCAVMGSVGSGKTTLLKALAGHIAGGVTEGSIRINGYAIGEHASRTFKVPTASYIAASDCHYSLLTVRETLEFAAMLRLRNSDMDSVVSVVDRTLVLLDLDGIAGCKVGCDDHPSISRGQMRRLTIGCGILHNASLLLVDQPTCTLDSYLSTAILNMLRTLANTKRTILCTLHAPSQSDFMIFDKVVLMNRGYVVYFGPVSECEQYFRQLESHNSAVPIVNVADYVIDVTAQLPADNDDNVNRFGQPSVIDLASAMAGMCDELLANHIVRSAETIKQENMTNWLKGNVHLLYVLLRRDVLKESRRWKYWLMHFSRCVALGIFLGTVFYDLDGSDEFGRMALFLQVYVVSALWISELLPDIHIEKSVLIQERETHATNMFINWLAMGFPVIINLVISCFCFSVPIYYMANLRHEAYHFILFVLILYVSTVGNLFMAYAVAFFTESYLSSVTIFPGVVGMQTFYCGYSVIISTLAKWFRWGASVNPGTYAMAAYFQNELKNNDFEDFEEFAEFFEWDKSLHSCFVYLLSFIVVNKLLLYTAMNIMKVKQ